MNELKIRSKIRDYSVEFVEDFTEPLKQDITDHSVVLLGRNISRIYKDKLNLDNKRHIVIDTIESNKSLDMVNTVVKTLLGYGIKRNDVLIIIGGGFTQDIGGFVASIVFRGIDWIFYPTTLLAQCDSCIGGKTSINIGNFKNQVGTFHPPKRVVVDFNFLKTLPESEIKSGMGEIIKCCFLNNNLEYLESKQDLPFLIKESLLIKTKYIEQDEFDRGYRHLLNYGHTFGHGIESVSRYSINHGQALTMGMDIANYISWKKGFLPTELYGRMADILLKNYPDFKLEDSNKKVFMDALVMDKKNVDEDISCILTFGPGKMQKRKVPFAEVGVFIDNFIKDR